MKGFVYFLEVEGEPVVKIGFSRGEPQDRLKSLQGSAWKRLILMGAVRGSIGCERALHIHFARHFIRGEWFRMSNPVRKEIAALLKAGTIPPKVLSFSKSNAGAEVFYSMHRARYAASAATRKAARDQPRFGADRYSSKPPLRTLSDEIRGMLAGSDILVRNRSWGVVRTTIGRATANGAKFRSKKEPGGVRVWRLT